MRASIKLSSIGSKAPPVGLLTFGRPVGARRPSGTRRVMAAVGFLAGALAGAGADRGLLLSTITAGGFAVGFPPEEAGRGLLRACPSN